jgi:hypothetical protein
VKTEGPLVITDEVCCDRSQPPCGPRPLCPCRGQRGLEISPSLRTTSSELSLIYSYYVMRVLLVGKMSVNSGHDSEAAPHKRRPRVLDKSADIGRSSTLHGPLVMPDRPTNAAGHQGCQDGRVIATGVVPVCPIGHGRDEAIAIVLGWAFLPAFRRAAHSGSSAIPWPSKC